MWNKRYSEEEFDIKLMNVYYNILYTFTKNIILVYTEHDKFIFKSVGILEIKWAAARVYGVKFDKFDVNEPFIRQQMSNLFRQKYMTYICI